MTDRPLILFPIPDRANKEKGKGFPALGIKFPTPQRQFDRFEPDKDNATIAEGKFQNNAAFHIKAAAVGEEDGFLSFNASGGASGYVGSDGKDTVPSVALDSFINDKLTYIKMDIEGAELLALRGGTKHIREDAPKLAICAYHKPDDLRVLISEIKSANPEYYFFLRHFSPKHKETVIFGIFPGNER